MLKYFLFGGSFLAVGFCGYLIYIALVSVWLFSSPAETQRYAELKSYQTRVNMVSSRSPAGMIGAAVGTFVSVAGTGAQNTSDQSDSVATVTDGSGDSGASLSIDDYINPSADLSPLQDLEFASRGANPPQTLPTREEPIELENFLPPPIGN